MAKLYLTLVFALVLVLSHATARNIPNALSPSQDTETLGIAAVGDEKNFIGYGGGWGGIGYVGVLPVIGGMGGVGGGLGGGIGKVGGIGVGVGGGIGKVGVVGGLGGIAP